MASREGVHVRALMLLSPEDEDMRLGPGIRKYQGYAHACFTYAGRVRMIQIHRAILRRMMGRELNPKELCDHINGNRLDNRRHNLRLVGFIENRQNIHARSNKTGFIGVSYRPRTGKYMAAVQGAVNGKHVTRHCSYHKTAKEAALAYNKAASELGFLTFNVVPE